MFDTDMLIHRHSIDPRVSEAAQRRWQVAHSAAIASFSRVEFKGNYIQDLILLRRKVADSDSIKEAFARVQHTGGRKSGLMLAQLVTLIGEDEFHARPWNKSQGVMLAALDLQVLAAWEELEALSDAIIDELACTRASEPPTGENGTWSATIPHCVRRNTRCRVVRFFTDNREKLEHLQQHLEGMTDRLSPQLQKILDITRRTLSEGRFPWEGTTCRSGIGDLLIGLQAVGARVMVSSNKAEHETLSEALRYAFEEFPIASIRLK